MSSLAKNAIAFLIDLAERGEIDPWNVKVIDVIDQFLEELEPSQEPNHGRSPYEANLSQSGQAFLYAAMLVLFKADTLARLEAEAETEETDDLIEAWATEDLGDRALPPRLERHIRRRASAAPPPSRKVTLPELIEQLELIATAMADPRPRRRSRRKQQPKRQAVRAIVQLAHQENLSEIAAILEQFLDQYWSDPDTPEEWLDFEQLLSLWPAEAPQPTPESEAFSTHHHDPNSDRVGIFWALLFLSAQSKVELSQEEFYQDLKVRHLSPATLETAPFPSVPAPNQTRTALEN